MPSGENPRTVVAIDDVAPDASPPLPTPPAHSAKRCAAAGPCVLRARIKPGGSAGATQSAGHAAAAPFQIGRGRNGRCKIETTQILIGTGPLSTGCETGFSTDTWAPRCSWRSLPTAPQMGATN